MFTRKWIPAISMLVISTTTMAVTNAEPTLKEIMQDLRDHLLEITDGLVTDDFDRVAQGAAGMAQHAPIPESQVQLIVTELGAEMAGFERFDELVHELSFSIKTAATERDRAGAISDYRRMIDGCLACHAVYKDRIAAVLSGRSPARAPDSN